MCPTVLQLVQRSREEDQGQPGFIWSMEPGCLQILPWCAVELARVWLYLLSRLTSCCIESEAIIAMDTCWSSHWSAHPGSTISSVRLPPPRRRCTLAARCTSDEKNLQPAQGCELMTRKPDVIDPY
jgi:hypothetical protein